MNLRLLVLILGAVSMAGQVCWSRLAASTVGGTFAAWAITLFGAMAGLSLGAFAGQHARRRTLALILLCGVTLMVMPPLLLLIARLEGLPSARAVLTALLLATAHVPFGAVLPALAAGRRLDSPAIYSLSAAGAVAGALLAGEILSTVMALDHLGLLLGVVTIASAGLVGRARDGVAAPPERRESASPRLVLAAFVLGALGLVGESLWMRILGFAWESNTRCFAFVTAATVAGLSAGSWAARRMKPDAARAGVALGAAAIVVAAAAAASPLAVHATGSLQRIAVTLVFAGLPAAASGAAFVILLGCLGGGSRALGILSAANSAGAAAGPLVLLAGGPWISWPPQLLLLLAGGYAALVGVVAGRRSAATGGALAATIAIAAWTLAPAGPAMTDLHPGVRPGGDFDTVTMPFLRPSLESTVAVTRDTRTGVEILWIDRGFQGDTSPLGRRIPEQLGSLPCELLGRPARSAMVIGLGTGVTLSAIVDSGAASVEVAELSRGVIEANRTLLADLNGHVLDRLAVRLRHGDGRPLLLDAAVPYDLIVADMVFPTVLGAANLFSREFYDLARRRLAEDGLFVHWLPCFLMSPEDLSAVVQAFLESFPEGSAWIGYFGPSRLILGLAGGAIHSPLRPGTADRLALGPSELRRLAGSSAPIRDADPRLEARSRESGDGRFGAENLKRVTALMGPAQRAWLLFAEAESAADPRRAAELYREASRAAPGVTEAEFHLSSLAYEESLEAARAASDRRDSELMLRHLRRAASHEAYGAGNIFLADVLAGRGRFEEALLELRKATAKSPRSADAQLKLALVARELGDLATAKRAFDAASALR
jgi:spermidine synthase